MMRKYLEVDGARIAYWDNGGHGPAVLCCHGNSSAGDAFVPLIERLGPSVRAISPDFYGHGGSPPSSPEMCGVKGYVRLITTFVQRLDLAPAVLVGHSLGGHAVLEALPELGAHARAAVLLSAPPFNLETIQSVFRDPTEGSIFRDVLTGAEVRRLADAFVKRERLSEEGYHAVLNRIEATAGSARAAIGGALARGAFADELAIFRGARAPIVLIQGKADPFINVDFYSNLPLDAGRDEVILVDGVRHSPHLEAVDIVQGTILRRLATRG